MSTQLDHTIVWSGDQEASARFLADILHRPPPSRFGRFSVVELDNGVSMDFATRTESIAPQHYAFLVDDAGFDHSMSRIRELGLPYWADPGRSQQSEINHRDGGRGVYFPDPDGHLFELITKPYGGDESSGVETRARTIPRRSVWEKWFCLGRS